jgi:hypothetical protein
MRTAHAAAAAFSGFATFGCTASPVSVISLHDRSHRIGPVLPHRGDRAADRLGCEVGGDRAQRQPDRQHDTRMAVGHRNGEQLGRGRGTTFSGPRAVTVADIRNSRRGEGSLRRGLPAGLQRLSGRGREPHPDRWTERRLVLRLGSRAGAKGGDPRPSGGAGGPTKPF